MPIPIIKVHSADKSIQTIDGANPLAVTLVAGGAVAGSVDVTDRAGRVLGTVVVTSISAGENHIGQVGSPGITIAQTPTVTAGAYAAGDAVGGLLTFANAGRVSGGGGVVKTFTLIDDAGQDVTIELWLFNQTFTAMADNAAWAPSEADLENLVGIISTQESSTGWAAAGTPSAITVPCSLRYDVTGTSLFGQLVTRGTPTFAATDDVTVKIGLLQD